MSFGYDVNLLVQEAKGLRKCDFLWPADGYVKVIIPTSPYPTTYISRVIRKSRTPCWNEPIHLCNMPSGAELVFNVLDKDPLACNPNKGLATYLFAPQGQEGAEEVELQTSKDAVLTIQVEYCEAKQEGRARHVGPIRYSRRSSRAVGAAVSWNTWEEMDKFSTWKVHLCDIPYHFDNRKQHWNAKYDKAIAIFTSATQKALLQQKHAFLYKQTSAGEAGTLSCADDFYKLVDYGQRLGERRYYTYVIMEYDLRFSETGAAFLPDKFSKHAMHSGVAEEVFYAGEFCIAKTESAGYKLVIDNQSGTYAPEIAGLQRLEALLKANFPDMEVETLTRDDPRLKEYHQQVPSRIKPAKSKPSHNGEGLHHCEEFSDPGHVKELVEEIEEGERSSRSSDGTKAILGRQSVSETLVQDIFEFSTTASSSIGEFVDGFSTVNSLKELVWGNSAPAGIPSVPVVHAAAEGGPIVNTLKETEVVHELSVTTTPVTAVESVENAFARLFTNNSGGA